MLKWSRLGFTFHSCSRLKKSDVSVIGFPIKMFLCATYFGPQANVSVTLSVTSRLDIVKWSMGQLQLSFILHILQESYGSSDSTSIFYLNNVA